MKETSIWQKNKENALENIVVVIGAAHAPGMIKELESNRKTNLKDLETIPTKRKNWQDSSFLEHYLF